MTRPDYHRVAEIVAGVHALRGEARAAFLTAACGDDAALRAGVEELLAHDVAVPDLLATAGVAQVLHAGFLDEPLDRNVAAHPEAIGAYRILEVLGQGGMGTVYRAEQTAPIHREVALKLVRRGLDTDRIIARFEGERQTLALMDHPAIARVLDAGASDDGRPYFVMELVAGTPVTNLCEERRLPITARLSLFLAVCSGVQHAHQKGIIHRDLKPSNVLVREQDGQLVPKIIDFGIAKAIEGDSAAGTLLTRAGDLMGTPEYMSPEQAGVLEGGVDTRTDVYSLGVILYELLTGQRPYSFRAGTTAEIHRVLGQAQPTRPSAVAPAHKRLLAGDLDNIALKALARAPADRYGSVEQLADDVRRHLDGLPVRAQAATWRYRTSKFVGRHRAGVAVAAAAVLVVSGAAAALAVQTGRLADERDRALAAEQRARAEATTSARVTEFLVDVFEVSDPSESRGNSVTVREVLDRGAKQLESDLADQPEIRATLQDAIGRVYQNLGLARVADALLEAALKGRRAVFGNDHAAVGESLDRLARLRRELGTGTQPEALYREALDIKRRTLGPAHPSIALTLNNLANAVRDRGDYAAAEALAREGLEMRRGLLGPEHADIAESLHDLGAILYFQWNMPEAEKHIRAALAIDRKIHGEDHPVVAVGVNTLGVILWRMGDAAGAESTLRSSISLAERLYGREHREVALSLWTLGDFLVGQQRFAEGEAVLHEGLAIHQRLSGRQSNGVARCIASLALSRRLQGDLKGAEAFDREHMALARAIYGDKSQRSATAQVGLAATLRLQGRLAEAETLADQAADHLRTAVGSSNQHTANALEELAAVEDARGRKEDSEAHRREVVQIRRAVLPAGHADTATALFAWGSVLAALGQVDAAVAAFRECVAFRRAALPAGHAAIADAERALAQASLPRPRQGPAF